MCKDLQENKITKMKFHEEVDQCIEQFKGEIIGQHFQYLLSTKTIFMNPEITSETYGMEDGKYFDYLRVVARS